MYPLNDKESIISGLSHITHFSMHHASFNEPLHHLLIMEMIIIAGYAQWNNGYPARYYVLLIDTNWLSPA